MTSTERLQRLIDQARNTGHPERNAVVEILLSRTAATLNLELTGQVAWLITESVKHGRDPQEFQTLTTVLCTLLGIHEELSSLAPASTIVQRATAATGIKARQEEKFLVAIYQALGSPESLTDQVISTSDLVQSQRITIHNPGIYIRRLEAQKLLEITEEPHGHTPLHFKLKQKGLDNAKKLVESGVTTDSLKTPSSSRVT